MTELLGRRSGSLGTTEHLGRLSGSLGTTELLGRRSGSLGTTELLGRRSGSLGMTDHLGRRSGSLGTTDSLHINREKMLCSLLLLLLLTSCVSGTLQMEKPQTFYQAEENQEILLEWMIEPDLPPDDLIIYCEKSADPNAQVLFHLHKGVEDPKSQDEQFAGRVQFDKDVLGEGRIRLRVSGLRISDSGQYTCQVFMDNVRTPTNSGKLLLSVSAADDPKPRGLAPQPENLDQGALSTEEKGLSQGKVGLFLGLAVAAAASVCLIVDYCIRMHTSLCDPKSTENQPDLVV
ncbi:uncharacterized protein LOC131989357 [Centropristis striata]|uniref:uncharacterized protein LOC131989357 n=1 Tax=Centropristis striata TaxID=184440 RepID=UPI0027DFC56D|nr:uncharacterized protein LOC131989357 [Centropristis striata]